MSLVTKISRAVGVVALGSALVGCDGLFNYIAERNLDDVNIEVETSGITQDVKIRRDAYGVPMIEADNIGDLAYGMGYSMAQDRLPEMVGMNLLSRGRLSEMAGPMALEMDIYMRTLGVTEIIEQRYAELNNDIKAHLQRFTDGVNAYIDSHEDRLPLELTLSDYQPEAWHASNTIGIFVLLNLGVGFNLHEIFWNFISTL